MKSECYVENINFLALTADGERKVSLDGNVGGGLLKNAFKGMADFQVGLLDSDGGGLLHVVRLRVVVVRLRGRRRV